MLLRRIALLAAVVTGSALSANAQQTRAVDKTAAKRAQLEQKLNQRTGDVVKKRLNLSDAQMTRLQSTNAQFLARRNGLVAREREVRREMRQQILSGDTANQARVGQLLDQTIQIERERIDLLQSEQRELSKFMTPVQRAKLFGLQTEIRRRTQELRREPGQRKRALKRPLN